MLEPHSTYANILHSDANQKHITSLLSGEEKKRYMHRAIESASDVMSHNTRAALQGDDYYLIIKLQITFNGNKLHRYD